ncbi:hypothetical protein, partial [Nitrospira sp. BLG_2]|uniref:hypothetical protein n=1 Tax=Nitrospira sp. BLG_2 TaxID=3397507 RepID=UPI003B9A61D1
PVGEEDCPRLPQCRAFQNRDLFPLWKIGSLSNPHKNLKSQFNYAGFDFSQLQGTTAGVEGNYKASHFVGGLAVHF